MDKKLSTIIVIIIIVIILLFIFWYILQCKPKMIEEKEQQCHFDSDCLGDNICFAGVCEPSTNGLHHCLRIPVTGRIIVKTDESCNLTYGDFRVVPFCATWNNSKLRGGGYVMKWGPSVMQYDAYPDPIIFEQQFAIISQLEYDNNDGFALSDGGIIPCDDNQMIATTPFKVYPIQLWQQVIPLIKYYDDGTKTIHIEFDPLSSVEEYAISIKVETPNYSIYRGLFSEDTIIDVQLYDFELANITNPTSNTLWFKVKIYGFRRCNMGLGAAGSGSAEFFD